MKEAKLSIMVDNLDSKLEMLHLKQRCSIGMAPLIKL
jgi:hypothetical protein